MSTGGMPPGMTARARARPVAPRCHRADRTGSCTASRPAFAPIVAPATPVWLSGNPAPAVARCNFSLALTRGRRRAWALAHFPHAKGRRREVEKGSHEDTKMFCQAAGLRVTRTLRLAQPGRIKRLRRKRDIFVSSCEPIYTAPSRAPVTAVTPRCPTPADRGGCRDTGWPSAHRSPRGFRRRRSR